MWILVLWIITPRNFVVVTNVSEGRTVSMFRAHNVTTKQTAQTIKFILITFNSQIISHNLNAKNMIFGSVGSEPAGVVRVKLKSIYSSGSQVSGAFCALHINVELFAFFNKWKHCLSNVPLVDH
jgi:hypothetical protein